MDLAEHGEDQRRPLMGPSISVSAVFAGSEEIADARALARELLTSLQAAHGFPVSDRAMGTVQLVVSELLTNAGQHAPGPCLLTLEVCAGTVEVTVWDSSTTLPAVQAPERNRIGRHGLEKVMAVCRSFEVHREPVGKRIKTAVALADPGEATRPAAG